MLRYEIKLKNGEVRDDFKVFSAVWKSELDVPADSLSLNCAYDGEIFNQGDRLSAYDGDTLIFDGQLDELSRIHSGSGVLLSLCARSAAAVLLDNEAEPLSYRNPTAALMYRRYLQPFGLDDVELDETPIVGFMRIDKGMTCYRALELFCKTRYGSKLRVSGAGRVYLRGYSNGKTVKFGADGVKYYSIKENKSRYKLISEVRLKVKTTAGYLSKMINANPECSHIKRARYVNTTAENNSLTTADNIIRRSNLEGHKITLTIRGCVTDILGARAELDDGVFGKISGLTVSKITYSLSGSGEYTTVVLGDREES